MRVLGLRSGTLFLPVISGGIGGTIIFTSGAPMHFAGGGRKVMLRLTGIPASMSCIMRLAVSWFLTGSSWGQYAMGSLCITFICF